VGTVPDGNSTGSPLSIHVKADLHLTLNAITSSLSRVFRRQGVKRNSIAAAIHNLCAQRIFVLGQHAASRQ
jgi:hypothetical protein